MIYDIYIPSESSGFGGTICWGTSISVDSMSAGTVTLGHYGILAIIGEFPLEVIRRSDSVQDLEVMASHMQITEREVLRDRGQIS